VRRDEGLEQAFAEIVSRPAWSQFIYKVSQDGDETRDTVVVHHLFMDGDPTFTVAISPVNGRDYRIQGFSDSLAEFEKLMKEADVKVLSPDQAEALAEFYRTVNPQRDSLTPIANLLELKQAAERQCQASSFEVGEREFEAWWRHAKSLYAAVPFKQVVIPRGSSYLVEWIVLSSAGPRLCGGAPLMARLEVGRDGRVGEISFAPLRR
jgi:hypothetical protein